MISVLLALPVIIFSFIFYLWHLKKALTSVPPEAIALSPRRWTVPQIEAAACQISDNPLITLPYLPPPTGRRYIVVGGSGFVGGWIVLHLLSRGEDPKNIRIIDIHRPTRSDLLTGKAAEVGFVTADIRNLIRLRAAFRAEWPPQPNQHTNGFTVFHTVAGIRSYGRHPSLISQSSFLNVEGTRNVLSIAQEVGVDIFIFTSAGSIPIRRTNFWVWPWQSHPKTLVQVVKDEVFPSGRGYDDFSSDYAYTKYLAERLVCEADDPQNRFRTGCLRPGNAVIGTGGDLITESYFARKINPSWFAPMIQSFTYVENVSYAHLLYEWRLIEALASPTTAPIQTLGGQSFLIADAGGPISHGDLYLALNTLTKNQTQFPSVSVLSVFLLAHLVESYYVLQACFPRLLPALPGDLCYLQPAIFDLVNIHFKIDDSRARLPPDEGGLGYQAPWTTLNGVCRFVRQHLNNHGDNLKPVESLY